MNIPKQTKHSLIALTLMTVSFGVLLIILKQLLDKINYVIENNMTFLQWFTPAQWWLSWLCAATIFATSIWLGKIWAKEVASSAARAWALRSAIFAVLLCFLSFALLPLIFTFVLGVIASLFACLFLLKKSNLVFLGVCLWLIAVTVVTTYVKLKLGSVV